MKPKPGLPQNVRLSEGLGVGDDRQALIGTNQRKALLGVLTIS